MAGYQGYFLKGLAGGIQSGLNMGQQVIEMKWQKAQKKKLQERQDKLVEAGNIFNAKVKEFGADNIFSDDEVGQLTTIYLAGGYEFQEHYQNAMNYISGMKDKEFNQELEWMDSFIDMTSGLSPDSIPDIYNNFERQFITSEKGKTLFAANKRIQEKRYKMQQQVVPDLSVAERKYNFAINAYNEGKINFEQLSKYMGTHIPPEEMSAKEKEIELMKQYGATNEEIKNKLLGISEGKITPEPTPAPTSTENIREDILNADTFADANRIYKNYADKYDETALGITDLKQEWASGQINYLNKVKKSIENLLVDRGDKGQWLNNKPMTQEEVGLEFKGERPASEIYKMLYKSYIEYLEKLRKLGINVSQFPELLPLGEIEKVDGTEGFFGWGIQKGDYKSIYK